MIIEVNQLCKHFGHLDAVRDLSFSVQEGDIFGFLGQNGAGKSTTIRMLLTLIKPSGGEIRIFGKELTRHRRYILERIGAIIEHPDLYPFLNGYDNLNLFSKLGGSQLSGSKLMDTLSMVGLLGREKDKVKTYSQGMRQRLGIAVALVRDPVLVILDEPTNGLDPQGIVDVRNLILRLNREEGKTFLVSSHLLSEIELIANRMLIIDRGKKVVEGDVRTLIDPGKVLLEIETDNPEMARVVIEGSRWNAKQRPSLPNRILLDMNKEDIPEVAALMSDLRIGLRSLKAVNTLEAYFLSLTNSRQHVDDHKN